MRLPSRARPLYPVASRHRFDIALASPRLRLSCHARTLTDLLAALHTDSWRHAYAGLIPTEHLESTPPAERLLPGARGAEDAEAPLIVTLLRADGKPAGFSLPDAAGRTGLRHLPRQPPCDGRLPRASASASG